MDTLREDENAAHHILVVDDDPLQRLLLIEFLVANGFTASEADNGRNALEAFTERLPDLVLLDVMMPELDGYAACTQMRQIPGSSYVPIVVLTGLDDADSVDRAYEVGATDFVTKPINFSLLNHRLRYVLRASHAMRQLEGSERRLTASQRIAQVGHWDWHINGANYTWSPQARQILGVDEDQPLGDLDAFCEIVHPADRQAVQAWFTDTCQGQSTASITHRLQFANEEIKHVRLMAEPVHAETGEVSRLYGVMQDITELRQAENRVRELAFTDTVTGLPNRAFFHERLAHTIGMARRNGRRMALLFLDLDDFKRINDTLGHEIGDRVLKDVAERLHHSIRETDVAGRPLGESPGSRDDLARLGGDEFTLLLTEIGDASDAAVVARRILDSARRPITVDSYEIFVTISIGIAVYPNDGDDIDSLLRNADLAMYFSKRHGKNRYQFFDVHMNETAQRKMKMENRLRQALDTDALSLAYQPQLDMRNGEICGLEALLRWDDPMLGAVSPMDLIPLAEDTGLIMPVGEWVLRKACTQAKAWLDAGLPIQRVAVNVSVTQLVQPEFPGRVRLILGETGLPPEILELEVTESLLVKDADATIRTLSALKDIGVLLAIDDFGTGYSNLGYLKSYPIDRLKIDRMFVQEVNSDPENAAIASAVIAMADSLRLRVIAEGVETPEQKYFFEQRQCDEIQGFLFSRPLSVEEVPEMLKKVQNTELTID